MSNNSMKVLIVDDEQEIRDIIKDNFEAMGFAVSTCESGNKAIEIFDKVGFNMVISDIRMPDGDGVDVLKHVKSKNPNYPAVFLISGYSDYELSELYAFGADGFFAKPFDLDDLKRNVKYALLSRSDFWCKRPNWTSMVSLRKTVENPGALLSNGDIQMGRGGFFVKMEKNLPPNGHPIEFEIFVQGTKTNLSRISGIGEIKWTREINEKPLISPNGYGIEIKYLDQSCRDDFIKWIEGCLITSYIPRGRS